ncbi:hypothetical protein [Muriicola jejuensis]|uniref:Lipocalin-like domain-containing protein n=1 Tax=Muriicola jejuensis TaxID=504488 RepID=A0A6P0UEY5_9FLAO|nr:hypothetical protein [Muriicola jejuensis]NER11805.1 hypothetical protein [Muriicola jejuensis]
MKKYLLFLYVGILSFHSCQSQKNNLRTIEGNWHPLSQQEGADQYIEIFIKKDTIYFYSTPLGLYWVNFKMNENKYFIDDRTEMGWVEKGFMFVENDTLNFKAIDGSPLQFIRINESTTLENFVTQTTTEDVYRNVFLRRAQNW